MAAQEGRRSWLVGVDKLYRLNDALLDSFAAHMTAGAADGEYVRVVMLRPVINVGVVDSIDLAGATGVTYLDLARVRGPVGSGCGGSEQARLVDVDSHVIVLLMCYRLARQSPWQ